MKILTVTLLTLAQGFNASANADFETDAVMDSKERDLGAIAQGLNSNPSNFRIELLSAGNTTLTTWQVKRGDQTVANLKCTDGNTKAWAELLAYKLGRRLESPMYPVVGPIEIRSKELSDMMVGTLRLAPISGASEQSANEKRAKRDQYVAKGFVGSECVLKEWAAHKTFPWFGQRAPDRPDFVSMTTFIDTSGEKKRLTDYLTCRSGFDGNPSFTFTGKKGVELGRGQFIQTAKAFSNMMLIDVLISNKDRFPGGNIAIREIDSQWKLFSLDNGAGGVSKNGEWSNFDMRSFLRRFDSGMIERLRELRADVNRVDFLNFEIFDQRSGTFTPAADSVARGIDMILHHYDSVQKFSHEKTYTVPAHCSQPDIQD